MGKIDRKARIREYKDTPGRAGVWRVHNTVAGKSLIGSTPNIPGILNRQRFQLENGSHPHKGLQKDWNELGPAVFEFEILDELEARDDPAYDPSEDLAVLEKMWFEKLTAAGETFYRQSRQGT
ncbi:MAG: GIY-YIG nuclease family protein [bacterium]